MRQWGTQYYAVAVNLFSGELFVTGEVSDTDEVWSPVKFGHRWSSPVILVTGDLGHRRGHRWSWSQAWSPVKFGHRRGHRWSWVDVLQPVMLLVGGESTPSVVHPRPKLPPTNSPLFHFMPRLFTIWRIILIQLYADKLVGVRSLLPPASSLSMPWTIESCEFAKTRACKRNIKSR